MLPEPEPGKDLPEKQDYVDLIPGQISEWIAQTLRLFSSTKVNI